MLHVFFSAFFSCVLDWIGLILVWFERSLHSAQASRQSYPWLLNHDVRSGRKDAHSHGRLQAAQGRMCEDKESFLWNCVTLCRFTYSKSVTSHGITTEMCFQKLILGKWKLDYVFIHTYEIVLSRIYMYMTQMLVKVPLFDKDSLSYKSLSRFA